MHIPKTTRIEPFDIDGNHLALHVGDPDLLSTESVFDAYPAARGITLTNRQGKWRVIHRRMADPGMSAAAISALCTSALRSKIDAGHPQAPALRAELGRRADH